jgi:hypothetical protein
MKDFEDIHTAVFEAYKPLMLLGGTDLEALAATPFALPRPRADLTGRA